jgi:hypothetical protein
MGTAYSARQSSYSDGDTIDASDSNNEFDAILSAFGTSGHSHDGTDGEGGDITALRGHALTFGLGTAGTDIVLTFDGETNDGVLSWMEDEDHFKFDDDVKIIDDKKIILGTNDDITIKYDETTNNSLEIAANVEGAALGVVLKADQGDDAGDEWKLNIADGGTLTLGNDINSAGTYVTHMTLTPNATVANSTAAFAGNVTAANLVTAGSLAIGGTTLTVTGAELNIVDGGTSATSTTVADADRVVFNDDGTMKQVAVTDLAAYFDDEITAMPNLTSVGTLTTLTVDNVIINGTTIGHTSDTDLMTVADGVLTVAGEVSMTTLDIGGTNVTSTAAEINLLDGGTSVGGSITIADSDGFIVNDGGTMKTIPASDLKTYTAGTTAADDIAAGDAAINLTTTSGNITIDAQGNDTDIILKGTDGSADTTFLTIDGSDAGTASFNHDVKLASDAAVLGFGSDNDVTLTHVHDTGLLLNGTMALQFNDASQSINAPSATVLDINATDEVEVNATLMDVNANLDVSGTYTGGGTMTTGGNIVIPDAGTIGSASDTDAVSITSAGNIGINTTSPAKKLSVNGPALATISALSDGSTITPDFDTAQNFSVTLGGNRTLANPNNIDAGQTGSIFVTQDGTGSRTLAFGNKFAFAGGTAPTLTTTASAVDRIDYIVMSSSIIQAVVSLDVKVPS